MTSPDIISHIVLKGIYLINGTIQIPSFIILSTCNELNLYFSFFGISRIEEKLFAMSLPSMNAHSYSCEYVDS